MTATARDRRDRLRAMLADLKMPGALEAVDGVLAQVDMKNALAPIHATTPLLTEGAGSVHQRPPPFALCQRWLAKPC